MANLVYFLLPPLARSEASLGDDEGDDDEDNHHYDDE